MVSSLWIHNTGSLQKINWASSLVKADTFLETSFYKCSAGDRYGTALHSISEKMENWSQKNNVLFGVTKYLWYIFNFFVFYQVLENN